MKVRWATFYHLRTAQVTNTILKTHVTLTVILFLQHIEMYKKNWFNTKYSMKLNIKNIFIYVMSYSIFLYFVLLVLFYTTDRNSWSRYVRHYLSFFPANIENNRHKWKFFEKEKVQYLLIGQKANYLLNKQSRARFGTRTLIFEGISDLQNTEYVSMILRLCLCIFYSIFDILVNYYHNKLFLLEE